MKSLTIIIVALLSLIVSPTTSMGSWPKPSELSNGEKLGQPQSNLYAGKSSFRDSKVWKCTYNNGSGAAVSITYPSPPQAPSQKPPTPSSPPAPKMAPPQPKPSPPRPTPKKSPPPPKQSPPPKPSPPRPTPKKSPPSPKPSPPPTPKKSPPSPTPTPPRPAPKTSPPPPNPSSPTPNESPPPSKTSILIIPSPPHPKESTPAQTPPKEPTRPSTPWPHYQNRNPWVHFINCMTEFGPSAVCKQQIQLSYYTGRFRVSDLCCNLFVNMRNECSDVILGFYNDPYFAPLLRCTCHVKIY